MAAAKIPTIDEVKHCLSLRKQIRADVASEAAAAAAAQPVFADKPDTCTDDSDAQSEEILSHVFESFSKSGIPSALAVKCIDKIAASMSCTQHSIDKLKNFYLSPGTIHSEEPEHAADEMDTHVGACKRPLSISSHGDEDDLEWTARFYDSTNFPSNFLEEEEDDLTPCIAEQSHIFSEEFDAPEEVPCLHKRMTKKTKSA